MIPKVSILIPIYGVEAHIAKCAKSVLSQKVTVPIECIFVDDASPDQSIDILNSVISQFQNNGMDIRVIRHDINRGLGQARNTAIEAAKGDYIFHLDSDDWLANDTVIEEMYQSAVKNDADIVEANHYKVFPHEEQAVEIQRDSNKHAALNDILHKRSSITIWNKLIRRTLYTDYDIRVPVGINNGEDYVTFPRLFFFANRIKHLDRYTYKYNLLNVNAFSANKKNWKSLWNMKHSIEQLAEFFKTHDVSFSKDVEAMNIETFLYLLLYCESREEIDTVVAQYGVLNYTAIPKVRWQYIAVFLLYSMGMKNIVLKIGKRFRSR